MSPPAIIVSGSVPGGLSATDQVILIQASLVVAALSALLQLFPIGSRQKYAIGSGFPVIMGISFAYVPTMSAIAESYGISAILGAQIIGGLIALVMGFLIKKIWVFFPPYCSGTVMFTIGLSLYPVAVNYMACGVGSAVYSHWENWLVAFFTLAIVTVLNHYGKGIWKLASILIGVVAGYLFAIPFGLVNTAGISNAALLRIPVPLHFSISFEASSCAALGILFAINSIQAISDYSATTVGAMDRKPTDQKLQTGIVGYGVSNMVSAPSARPNSGDFSQLFYENRKRSCPI